jgi:hypothetical protein
MNDGSGDLIDLMTIELFDGMRVLVEQGSWAYLKCLGQFIKCGEVAVSLARFKVDEVGSWDIGLSG